jgi:hypothetical protein
MPIPMMADVKRTYDADVGQPIKCAVVVKPTEAQRHREEIYYTEGNSVTVKHVSSLAPPLLFARLS